MMILIYCQKFRGLMDKRKHGISRTKFAWILVPCLLLITACRDNKDIKTNPNSQVLSAKLPATTPSPPVKSENLTFTAPAKFQGKTLYQAQIPNQTKVIALTFDDGPWLETTPQILNILKQNNVKATFFWVGTAIQANPDIAKQVVADGHAIANHTFHHWYKRMDQVTAKSEIDRTADLIYRTTGVKTTLFRPPGGHLNNGLVQQAKSQNYTIVMWSQTSADTDPRAKYQVFIKMSSEMLNLVESSSCTMVEVTDAEPYKLYRG